MNNQQIINNRWKITDKELKKIYPTIKDIFSAVSDDVLALFKEMAINRTSLNKTVPNSVKRAFKRKVKKWKQDGLVKGYFEYLLDNLKKYTYSNILKACLYATYSEAEEKVLKESKQVFIVAANDCYKQAKKEIPHCPITVPDILSWAYISKWLNVVSLNCSYEEYLESLTMTNSDEMYNKCVQAINSESDLKEEDISKLIEKQQNRILNVSETTSGATKDDSKGSSVEESFEKFSGVMETMARTVGNKAYVEPFGNQKVKFVAELDNRTTQMCLSLNGQIFNTTDENKFKRYSDAQKAEIEYDVKGLVEGINLPPIVDHFHWCRSTISYQIQKTIDDLEESIFGVKLETYNVLKKARENGEISDRIKLKKQKEHSTEEEGYIDTKSSLLGTFENAEQLYKKNSGHGELEISERGIREVIRVGKEVGNYRETAENEAGKKIIVQDYPSEVIRIQYSKGGYHLYAWRDEKQENK